LVADRQAPVQVVVTLGEGLAAVLAEQAMRGRASPRSRAATEATTRVLLSAWQPELPLASITSRELDWYLQAAIAKGRSITSVLQKDIPLLRRAMMLGGASWPVDWVRPRLPRRPMSVLTPQEVRLILDRLREPTAPDPASQVRATWLDARAHHADLIELLWLTGLRSGELARLTLGDVDPQRCCLRVTNHKDAGVLDASVDEIQLPESAQALLERLVARAKGGSSRPADSRKLIPGGEHFLDLALKRIGARLGEPRLSGRTLRHSFVSAVLQTTGDMALTRDLARHRSVATTTRYVHALQGDQRAARAALVALLADSGPTGSP
jgi:integrase